MNSARDIAADIRAAFPYSTGLLEIAQVMRYLGYRDYTTAKAWLADVPVVRLGKKNKYLIKDIALKIYTSRREMI